MSQESKPVLKNNSRVAVVGGGPAGSLFSCFLLDMAQRVGMDLEVDIYEPRDFSAFGPVGCNMSGCIISEPLVQTLAAEGINLTPLVVRRGIDSYQLHLDVGDIRIETPINEKRIASVHRGSGPRGLKESKWQSFDRFLLELAINKGARHLKARVDGLSRDGGRPRVKSRDGAWQEYDLLVAALGVNGGSLKLFEELQIGYKAPTTTKAHVREYCLGEETVERHLGGSIHIFLPHIARLDFACLIPKGEFATLCLLGHEIDDDLVKNFLDAPEVKRFMSPDLFGQESCRCFPRLNIQGATQPYADRIVFVGDSGITRLYKDGIGAAYRTAKAAAVTAVFQGISEEDFRRHYVPVCQGFVRDNKLGSVVFSATRQLQMRRPARSGLLRMVSGEQQRKVGPRPMSTVLWDTFTGSAPYREVFLRSLRPAFVASFLWNVLAGYRSTSKESEQPA